MSSYDVKIVNYEPKYQPIFKSLNEQWISENFEIEDHDDELLNYPEEYILKKGGEIFVALLNEQPVGVIALVKTSDYVYEMAKMAVSEQMRGKKIGEKLGRFLIDRAKERGAKILFLESNTVLTPAITLYYKLGFKKVESQFHYSRANIYMEINFDN